VRATDGADTRPCAASIACGRVAPGLSHEPTLNPGVCLSCVLAARARDPSPSQGTRHPTGRKLKTHKAEITRLA